MLLLLALLPAPADAADVLVLHDTTGGSTPALVTAIEAQGHTVTVSEVPEYEYDGTNPALDGFEVVVHLNGTTFDSGMTVAGSEALRDYVQLDGGGYVHFEWDAYAQENSQQPALRDLTLFDRESSRTDVAVTMTATAGFEDHPLLEGVTFPYTFDGVVNTGPMHTFASEPASLVATDDAGHGAIALRRFGLGAVVGFHHSGNWSGRDHFDDAGLARLAANAVSWVSDCDRDDDGALREGACGGDDCDDDDDSIGAPTVWYIDGDEDGYGEDATAAASCSQPPSTTEVGGDCDDTDETIYPGATEVPYDGIDQDCDEADLCDVDGDGADADQGPCGGDDCDDDDATILPGATEVPYDGIDQDCDGADVCDVDGDGFDAEEGSCGGDDCDDDDATVFPGAEEIEDGLDNDCNGEVDDVPGCGCATGPTPAGALPLLGLLALAGLRRRR